MRRALPCLPIVLSACLSACAGPRLRLEEGQLEAAQQHRLQVSTHHLRAAGYVADIDASTATIRHKQDDVVRSVSCTSGAGFVTCSMGGDALSLRVESEAGELSGSAGPYTIRSTTSLQGGVESADVAGLWIRHGDVDVAAVQLYGPYYVWLPEPLGPERDDLAAWALVLAWVAPTLAGESTPERSSWPAPP